MCQAFLLLFCGRLKLSVLAFLFWCSVVHSYLDVFILPLIDCCNFRKILDHTMASWVKTELQNTRMLTVMYFYVLREHLPFFAEWIIL